MLKYKELNVNPKHRKTGDCSTRALTSVLGIKYEDCLRLQMDSSLKMYYDPTSKQVMSEIMELFGYVKMKQPRKADNTKYTVRELDRIIPEEKRSKGVLVSVAHHYTAIVGDELIDIWNCGGKTVGNYWIKK